MFLVLMCGVSQVLPQGLDGDPNAPRDAAQVGQRERQTKQQKKRKGKRVEVKKKDWIAAKKERRRIQGKETKKDSKYSGRSRGPKF